MNKVFIIYRRHVLIAAIAAALVIAGIVYWTMDRSISVSGSDAGPDGIRTIHMVTGEFKSTHLSIYGVNGESHPFYIEGTNVKGEVKKGKETVVTFTPQKEGTYRIICLMHPDIAHHGPMIGYIVVD
ncbi:MAG: cupredoxin [Paenibacillaceae bacterium]|nr:cupredoxin [Paenibacillaceae bacterium]